MNKQKRDRIFLCIFLIIFVLLSLSRSFRHYYVAPLDGDIAESALPYSDIQKTFDDPTGIKTIINNDPHAGVNRFFSHYFLHKTFREVPLFLQKFCSPIESVYYTSAISKLVIQIIILLLFAFIINGNTNIFSLKFLTTTALLIPFIFTNGKYLAHEIGIMDKYATYCFFYALPLIFLLLYYLPVFFELLHHKKFKMNWIGVILWTVFALIACFSGPIIPPIILITNFILFFHFFCKNWQSVNKSSLFGRIFNSLKTIDRRIYFFIFPITILALYSTFLGTYNNHFSNFQLSLKELYLILPKGILKSFTTTGYVIFIILLLINYLIVFYKYKNDALTPKIFGLYKFLILFTVLYVALLPLGGYRPYRPFVLRYDTLLPITVLSIITICYTSIFIFKRLKTERWNYYLKIAYSSVFFLILTFFLIKNKTYVYNECEKASLQVIANSEEDIVVLDNDCTVVGWEVIYNPEESRNYGNLLYLWKITDKPKLYYNLSDLSGLSCTDFIYLNDKHFELRNERFFPVMLNYCVSFRNINNELVVSPYINYEKMGEFEHDTKEETAEQLRGHFQLIKEMGFNSLRVTFDRCGEKDGKYYYSDFSIDDNYEKILAGFEDFIDIATEKELRIMFLLKPPFDKSVENFTIKILNRFKENPTIFAYDFLNEPLYFDPEPKRSKESAKNLQLRWKTLMQQNAPNQLFTIGFSEPIEVFEWDPAMSPVDFVCFHTYHPLRVKSEIYWYAKYINKPLMIGEIALPADDDSVPYSHQANFAKEISKYAIDCGIAGFGWWDFQEDLAQANTSFEAAYTGILNHEGTTTTANGKYTIIGTVKPVAEEIKKIAEYQSKNEKEKPVNYYNNLGYNNFVIKGKIIDQKTKKPIEGAVIRGWTQWWNIAWNTYSDENGNFTLYSNEKFVHFAISAPNYSLKTFDKELKYTKITNENYDINNLPNRELEYHKISYTPFLKDCAHSVFDFEPAKFNQAKFEGDMGVVKLKCID